MLFWGVLWPAIAFLAHVCYATPENVRHHSRFYPFVDNVLCVASEIELSFQKQMQLITVNTSLNKMVQLLFWIRLRRVG